MVRVTVRAGLGKPVMAAPAGITKPQNKRKWPQSYTENLKTYLALVLAKSFDYSVK